MSNSPRRALIDWRLLLVAARNVLFTLLILAVPLILYCTTIESYWLKVAHTNVSLQNLQSELQGFTIVQISDLHFGRGPGEKLMSQVLEQTAQQKPDLVVLTGDFLNAGICHDNPLLGQTLVRQLTQLHGRYGVYAVLGNHDVRCGVDAIAVYLQKAGVTVLRDERAALNVNGRHLWLIGIEDVGIEVCPGWTVFQDLHQAKRDNVYQLLADIPETETRILLVHNPDFAEILSDEQVDLVLAGHTHGGYVHLPFLGEPLTPSCFGNQYSAGLRKGSHTQVYVNRGVGGLSVRLNSRPEIAVLQLTKTME